MNDYIPKVSTEVFLRDKQDAIDLGYIVRIFSNITLENKPSLLSSETWYFISKITSANESVIFYLLIRERE